MENNIFVNFIKKNRKYSLLIFDVIVVIIAYLISIILLSEDVNYFLVNNVKIFGMEVAICAACYIAVLLIFDMYSNITRYENGNDYLIYILFCTLACLISTVICQLIPINILSIKTNLISCGFIIMGFISYRVIIRMVLLENEFSNSVHHNKVERKNLKNLLIIGAGSAARDIIKIVKLKLRNEYNIVGIIDDNINKLSYSIAGIKILGTRNKIEEIAKIHNVDTIFFTISRISPEEKRDIIDKCQKTGAKIRVLQSTENIIKSKNMLENLRDLSIEDVLYREEIKLDNTNINKLIKGKTVIVTGGGGSIGSELCKQIIRQGPSKLIILDIYENNLYNIQMELKRDYPKEDIICIIGSVRDKERLDDIWKKYKPTIVFHAAAHKHVPLMEESPIEAIKNNVFGTYNVIECCDRYLTEKCILISTDKAVNPTNIMGATKRLAEMIIQAKNTLSKTEFVAVRFGNVLDSNGSVIPLFKKQIQNGGPVTVTHEEVTRFFMTIPEAVNLVLQASTYANGGEIFVLDMGKPVKIYDLAVKLVELAGLKPNVDIKIEITGLRKGEKLYEELLMEEEGIKGTKHEKIYVAKPVKIFPKDVETKLAILKEAIKKEDITLNEIKSTLKSIVPTYVETSND